MIPDSKLYSYPKIGLGVHRYFKNTEKKFFNNHCYEESLPN